MENLNLLLINYEYPPLGGGAGNATFYLARELTRLGTQVRVLTSAFGDLARYEIIDGYTVQRIPVARRYVDRGSVLEMMLYMFVASVAALRLVQRWCPDVTIAFFGIPGGPPALLLKAVYCIPYIVSLRGGDVPEHLPELSWYHCLTKPLIKYIWHYAYSVVANSKGLRKLAENAEPHLPFQVIPSGVDTELFYPPKNNFPKDAEIRLLFVGRISYEKGFHQLLPALSQLIPITWRLDIVGDGPFLPTVKEMVKNLNLNSRVYYHGWVHKNEILAYYQVSHILTLLSTAEGLPNVILEAMACGLPVVATRVRGNEDLVQDGVTGFLIPPEDGDTLTVALQRLLSDADLRRRMGASGRQRALEEFSWQRTAQQYLELCQQAVRV